jgi:crossover junction endodeoxyribonuclease RuvC
VSGFEVIGIDPGLGGGIAIINPNEGSQLFSMPVIGNELDLKVLATFLLEHSFRVRVAYLEKATAMPKQGVVSMFKFGRVFGACEAMLAAFKIPFILVRPQEWQKVIHEGIPRTLDPKERSRLAFSRIFPSVDARRTERCKGPDMGLVDAALIAHYGRSEIAL